MINFNNYLKTIELPNYDNVKENLIYLTKNVVQNYFKDKPMFEENNFKYYYYDDYFFNTNNSNSNYITLYIEINQEKNIKTIQNPKFRKKVKDDKIKELHLTLEEIKNGLFENYILSFDNNTVLWQEKYSINLSVNEIVDEQKVNYLIRVIPCFKYVNENNIEGVIYYDNSMTKIEIEYPLISTQNLIEKNEKTNGLYHYFDVVIKNLFLECRKENFIYFEIFETLLYNVPNKLFVDESIKTLTNIINFLRNNNIKDYKTIDEQDYAFTSIYKSFSILFAKHALSQLEKYIKKLM